MIATDEKNLDPWQKLIDNRTAGRVLAQKTMNDYLRLTLVTAIHFQIDNLFHALLEVMNDHPTKHGFSAYAGKLREKTKSSNCDFNSLMALTNMRNCFHNNGIHKNKELRIVLGEYEIEFIPNQKVPYSIGHVFAVLKVAIPVVCSWLMKAPISELTDAIQDPGALAAGA